MYKMLPNVRGHLTITPVCVFNTKCLKHRDAVTLQFPFSKTKAHICSSMMMPLHILHVGVEELEWRAQSTMSSTQLNTFWDELKHQLLPRSSYPRSLSSLKLLWLNDPIPTQISSLPRIG